MRNLYSPIVCEASGQIPGGRFLVQQIQGSTMTKLTKEQKRKLCEDWANSGGLHGDLINAVEAKVMRLNGIGDGRGEAVEMSPEFTDTSRAALCWVLWHHQGASSEIGQAMRFALGMGRTERLNEHQVAEAKRWATLATPQQQQAEERPKPILHINKDGIVFSTKSAEESLALLADAARQIRERNDLPQEQAAQQPLLVRDLAEIIGKSVPAVSAAIADLGLGNRSTNMYLHPDEAIAVAKHFAQPAAQVAQPLSKCAAGRDGDCFHAQCPQLRDGEPAKSRRHCPLDGSGRDQA